jgi:hypothetical protein
MVKETLSYLKIGLPLEMLQEKSKRLRHIGHVTL